MDSGGLQRVSEGIQSRVGWGFGGVGFHFQRQNIFADIVFLSNCNNLKSADITISGFLYDCKNLREKSVTVSCHVHMLLVPI